MATGFNGNKINALKVDMLNCVEQLKILSGKLDSSIINIGSCYQGEGASTIVNKLNEISLKFPKVMNNINSYINDINCVVSSYENQDRELASSIIRDIDKIDI